MSLEEVKVAAKQLFSEMPEEVFSWFVGRIEANGWPPSGSTWEGALCHRPLSIWQRLKWKRELVRLDLDSMNSATLTVILALEHAYTNNISNSYTNYVVDSHERFASIENYLRQNRQLPSTLIFLSDGKFFDIVDGCHRLAVFFSWRNNPEFRDLVSDNQMAWVGYDPDLE